MAFRVHLDVRGVLHRRAQQNDIDNRDMRHRDTARFRDLPVRPPTEDEAAQIAAPALPLIY